MPDWPAIAAALDEHGIRISKAPDDASFEAEPVRGGDINAAWRIEAADKTLFIKTGSITALDMFMAEAEGLQEIAAAGAVRVPAVYACDSTGESAFIALEWLDLEPASRQSEQRFGERLAALHRCTAPRFGWHRDNTIGLTPQMNSWTDSWLDFYRDKRLLFQLNLADENGFGNEIQTLGRRVADHMDRLFVDYSPLPSLLHGDLWGGNWATVGGEPVIFDPAVYYGDRESDLAMTRLFGGFGSAFYDTYESCWPVANGASARQDLYQLYHLLNHLNLFGAGYAGSVRSCLQKLAGHLRC